MTISYLQKKGNGSWGKLSCHSSQTWDKLEDSKGDRHDVVKGLVALGVILVLFSA